THGDRRLFQKISKIFRDRFGVFFSPRITRIDAKIESKEKSFALIRVIRGLQLFCHLRHFIFVTLDVAQRMIGFTT
ncbi:MAG TPA: hypothetical protein VFU09_07395, partial [Candidatus Udaeobacter sp.]|nr:hypothetical protein [Candidatus Udaeobacter sp.]